MKRKNKLTEQERLNIKNACNRIGKMVTEHGLQKALILLGKKQ